MDLTETVTLVTGGGQGIGRGIADAMMTAGANVVLADIDEEAARESAERLRSRHDGDAVAVECDVRRPDDVAATTETTVERFGRVDCLVNNVGETAFGRTWELSESEFDIAIDSCLRGTFLCTRAVVDHMLEANVEGSIINISSLNATLATDGLAIYSAAKAGVEQFTKAVASEVGSHGIQVNAIAPGVVRTPGTKANGLVEGAMGEAFIERTPLADVAEPEDIANVAVFLASDYAGWITGETIHVDGGQHVRGIHSYWDTLTGDAT